MMCADDKDVNLKIDQMSRAIRKMFNGYTILMVVLRLFGHGHVLAGFLGFISELQEKDMRESCSVGEYLFIALLVLISVYSLKTNFNERCRKLVQSFSICAFLNYISIIVLFAMMFISPNEKINHDEHECYPDCAPVRSSPDATGIPPICQKDLG